MNLEQEQVVDLFLYMGQSNNGGSGDVSTLTADSLEIIGKDLSTTQQNVLFSLSHHETDNIHDTSRVDKTIEDLRPTITSSNPDSYGAELSFGSEYKSLSQEAAIAIKKYYVNGATIEYFDKDLSETDGTPTGSYGTDFRDTGPKNCWDNILEIWTDLQAQETALNIKFNVAGFIWWQGTSDISNITYPGTSLTRAEAYEDNLTRLIQNIRELFGKPNLPVGVVMPHDDRDTTDAASRTTLQNGVTNVVSALNNISLVDPVDYKNTGQAGYFDGIHWGGKGHLEIGRLLAKEMYYLVTGYTPNKSIFYNMGKYIKDNVINSSVIAERYERESLPDNPANGTLALVSGNIGLVYANEGEWYRVADNTIVIRTSYQLDPDYIFPDQQELDSIIILKEFTKDSVLYQVGDIVDSNAPRPNEPDTSVATRILIRQDENHSWTHVFWDSWPQRGVEWEKVILA